MAKLSARGCYEMFAVNTERSLKLDGDDSPATLYRERWALRSDGRILWKIVWTETPGRGARFPHSAAAKHPDRVRHSSSYSLHPRLRVKPDRVATFTEDRFCAFLEGRGYKIVS